MKVFLLLLLVIVFVSCDNDPSWVEQGHIDPNDCNSFIVNDSIVIKSTEFRSYSVFVHGDRDYQVTSTCKETNKDDEEMINTLEWRYKNKQIHVIMDYSIGRNPNCIELKTK